MSDAPLPSPQADCKCGHESHRGHICPHRSCGCVEYRPDWSAKR